MGRVISDILSWWVVLEALVLPSSQVNIERTVPRPLSLVADNIVGFHETRENAASFVVFRPGFLVKFLLQETGLIVKG